MNSHSKWTRTRVSQALELFVLLSLFSFSANAATITASFNQSWSALGATSADNVIVDAGVTLTVDVNNAACASLQVGSSVSSADAKLVFNSGSQLTISGN